MDKAELAYASYIEKLTRAVIDLARDASVGTYPKDTAERLAALVCTSFDAAAAFHIFDLTRGATGRENGGRVSQE